MKKKLLFLGCFLLTLGTGSLQAWWDAGHMVVASIAYERLTPAAREHVDELVAVIQRDYPYTNHFVATATWPDDLKGEGVHAYDAWHYTNIPYNPDHIVTPAAPEVDVVWAIKNCQSVLGREQTRPIEKARALAFLVHCVGDVHQPLHCGSMYTNACPGGDLGGNKFDIEDSHRQLHKLWDDACGLTSELNDVNPYGAPREAITKAELKRVANFAQKLTDKYPEGTFGHLNQLDPDFWALEGHKLAVRYAYHGVNGQAGNRNLYLEPGGAPSAEYLEKGKEIAGQQIARAGYRLALVLNQVWGN